MSEQKGKLSKGGIIALAICAVVIIILLGLVIFLMLNKEKKGRTNQAQYCSQREKC